MPLHIFQLNNNFLPKEEKFILQQSYQNETEAYQQRPN
jgi:hypothetical protein